MRGKRLLIIEDDADLREGLRFSFAGDGYDVTDVGTKKKGLEKSEKAATLCFWTAISRTEPDLNCAGRSANSAWCLLLC